MSHAVMVMSRATKSQNFSAILKVHETSTIQISRSHHEGIPSYQVKKKVNLSLGQNFLAAQFFFLFIDTLSKLQQQILICFCKF